MKISDWQIKKIERLAEYQESLADLYALLGERFPGLQSQFLTQAINNIGYGDWLRSVPEKILSGQYGYKIMRFKIESVVTGLNYLRGQFTSISQREFNQRLAVGLLKGIESGDIASKFFEIVYAENEFCDELQRVKERIKSEKREALKTLQSFNHHDYSAAAYS